MSKWVLRDCVALGFLISDAGGSLGGGSSLIYLTENTAEHNVLTMLERNGLMPAAVPAAVSAAVPAAVPAADPAAVPAAVPAVSALIGFIL